ncbi:MAG TPA: hypothetical protein VNN62_23785 [Methylomirabilota bacterium]|nr:hypothetical protein [Methylomirabilota bacterium]
MTFLNILPPVFVMNLYYTGIGIARNLYGYGVRVYGLSSEKDAPGVKSRFFDGVYEVPNGRDEPEALYRRLLEIREHYTTPPVIFPTRDFDILFLHQYREQLAPFYRLPQPQDQTIPRILDKLETALVAERCHIPIPKTVVCTSVSDLEEKSRSLDFPLVVKPRFAYQWRHKGTWEKVGARKAFLVRAANQLRDEYRQLTTVTQEILLQEYIEGEDSDIVVCCCYIDQRGKLLGYFTARKLCQTPPLFGTGCLVEIVNIPEIISPSVQLLQAFGYVGLAEIEFKHNKSTNTFSLIEVNPRHWDQHELGNTVGVNLTWIAYQHIIGQHIESRSPTYNGRVPCKWIAERELVTTVIQSVFREIAASQATHSQKARVRQMSEYCSILKKTAQKFAALLYGQKIFAVLHARDPLPGFLLCSRIARELAKTIVTRMVALIRAKI